MVRFKIYFESTSERICCWFGYEVLGKEQIYWVNPLGDWVPFIEMETLRAK